MFCRALLADQAHNRMGRVRCHTRTCGNGPWRNGRRRRPDGSGVAVAAYLVVHPLRARLDRHGASSLLGPLFPYGRRLPSESDRDKINSPGSVVVAHRSERSSRVLASELSGKSAQVGHKRLSHSNIKNKPAAPAQYPQRDDDVDGLPSVRLRESATALRSVDNRAPRLPIDQAKDTDVRAGVELKRQIEGKLDRARTATRRRLILRSLNPSIARLDRPVLRSPSFDSWHHRPSGSRSLSLADRETAPKRADQAYACAVGYPARLLHGVLVE